MTVKSFALRAAISIVLFGALYWWCYDQGLVSQLTAKLGLPDPGQILIGAPAIDGPPPAVPGDQTTPEQATTALATATSIPVASTMATGYVRENFTSGWKNVDGCDTRNIILARDLTDAVRDNECRVTSGVLTDPYNGTVVNFTRGTQTSSAVQIDHVVSLASAWRLGASAWAPEQREKFANDPANLRAVDGPTNARKSDKTLSEFAALTNAGAPVLAPDRACAFTVAYVEVSATYELAWTAQDAAYATETLLTCGASR